MKLTTKTVCLVVGALITAIIAAPATGTGTEVSDTSKVRDAASSTCTIGTPATEQNPSFPINDFTYVGPTAGWTSYAVKQDWYDAHFVSGPHVISSPVGSDPYGAFKCQYTCNGAGNCNSFFAWHVNVGTSEEHANCVLFDAVMDASVFEQSNGTMGAGGYDRICRVGTEN